MFGSNFVSAITANVNRANDAIARGDNIGAAQAISQALAVTAAGIAGGLWSATAITPLTGLSIVFNSLSNNPGLWAQILRQLGIDALDASRLQAIIKTYAAADWTARGVDYAINWINEHDVGGTIYDWTHGDFSGTVISPTVGTTPDPLVKTIIYVDPLVLDLDGDGLEITPLSKGILFDANGDAVKTGTAWVGADDGLLVWDRNGNGTIDTGAELFGDETILANGQKAAHGFAALSELDTGSLVDEVRVGAGDGVFDAQDAQYSSLRILQFSSSIGIANS